MPATISPRTRIRPCCRWHSSDPACGISNGTLSSNLGNVRVLRLLRGGYYCQYVCNPLTEEAVMVSHPKDIGVGFCGLLLSLGLSTVAQAEIFDRRQGD